MIEKEKKDKNLFEVNGIKYIDNIPKDMRISLTKEQYSEYLQQKELIDKLQKENEDREQAHMKLYNEFRQYKDWDSIPKDKIREKIKELEEEQDEEDTRLDEAGFDLGTRNYLTTIEEKLQLLRELLKEE